MKSKKFWGFMFVEVLLFYIAVTIPSAAAGISLSMAGVYGAYVGGNVWEKKDKVVE